jgi:hypothetical protein
MQDQQTSNTQQNPQSTAKREVTIKDLAPAENVGGGGTDPVEFIVVGSGAGGRPLAGTPTGRIRGIASDPTD